MNTENLTREAIVKFFTKNKRKKITLPTQNYFWNTWKSTNFPQEPLIHNILSCILFAHNKLTYDKNGNLY